MSDIAIVVDHLVKVYRSGKTQEVRAIDDLLSHTAPSAVRRQKIAPMQRMGNCVDRTAVVQTKARELNVRGL